MLIVGWTMRDMYNPATAVGNAPSHAFVALLLFAAFGAGISLATFVERLFAQPGSWSLSSARIMSVRISGARPKKENASNCYVDIRYKNEGAEGVICFSMGWGWGRNLAANFKQMLNLAVADERA